MIEKSEKYKFAQIIFNEFPSSTVEDCNTYLKFQLGSQILACEARFYWLKKVWVTRSAATAHRIERKFPHETIKVDLSWPLNEGSV